MNGFGNVLTIPSLPNISDQFYQTGTYTPGGNLDPYVQETAPYIPTSPAPYIPDIALPPSLQPPSFEPPSILQPPPSPTYIPDWELPSELQPTFSQPGTYTPGGSLDPNVQETAPEQPASSGYGPIELLVDIVDGAGKVIGKAGEIIWDTGKFILDHLSVGVAFKGDIGGVQTQQKYYEDQGFSAEEALFYSMYSALQSAGKPVEGTGQQIPGQQIPSQSGQPMYIPSQPQTATAEPVSTKLILYAAIGVGVLLVASRIFKK